eukprot:gnl/TRDRNA2_/TRDRNA2_172326_c5_seq1.p1 gnl/TRDRNA2_/TRDRNA2_172326_c5~~gnl/TRDRNA2_/TRDRNA2_172326_c5_seq1.p1  ORF type:complete len:372 (+),score=104.32 gnl/TRDRNA2_/TRDRNA2_172326_c5_seq1:56-1117(+)
MEATAALAHDALKQRLEDVAAEHSERTGQLHMSEAMLAEVRAASEEQAAAIECLDLSVLTYRQSAEELRRQVSELKEATSERESRLQRQRADLDSLQERTVDETGRLQGIVQAREEELRRVRADAEVHEQRREADARTRQQQHEERATAQEQREAELTENFRSEAAQARELEERLVLVGERLEAAEARTKEVEAALARSKLLERQALERAQEFRMSLALLQEFGHEDFMKEAPRVQPASARASSAEVTNGIGSGGAPVVRSNSVVDEHLGEVVKSVLISVELDLGFATATMSVAPWQTSADFEEIVTGFLQQHRVKPVFKDALVRYLEEVEAKAETFPVMLQADLADLYSTHG